MALTDDVVIVRPQTTMASWRRRSLLWQVAGYLAMAFVVLMIGMPVYWTVVASFKESREIYTIPPTWWPEAPTLANYMRAWNAAPFGRYYINSLITTTSSTAIKVVFAVFSAYALVFLRFPRKNLVFLFLLAALMVPREITIIPNYITVARLGWINTYQGIIIPGAAVAYGTFLLRQYFRTLPQEVLEAARVDGAGHVRILWSVVLPMSQPAVVTMTLLALVDKWNDFLWPLIITNTADMRVLPIGIFWLLDQEGVINWGVVMAGTLFVMLPMLLIFLWAQRYIVEGIASGAVKG